MSSFATYQERHIGPDARETGAMLKAIGVASMDELIDRTVPRGIRLKHPLEVGAGLTELEHLEHMRNLGEGNRQFRSYIGLGYHGTIVPQPILRNILENPGWYTAYTPYQAEISQGRLEALLNFQTMVSDLTALPIANASLLDEGTAAAEAMLMFDHARPSGQRDRTRFFVDRNVLPQTIDVLWGRALPVGIEIVVGDIFDWEPDTSYFGLIVQYPFRDGSVPDLRDVVTRAKAAGIRTVACADLLALAMIAPPGEWGADVCVGNSQRFGVPMGYGGPHAAFFACTEEWKRLIPGRIIGVSQDRRGKRALRMALQTREQHIRRDKATSNICTAQALLAVMAGMYAVYHGPDGLRRIARRVHEFARQVAGGVQALGYTLTNNSYFDTLTLVGGDVAKVRAAMEAREINLLYGTGSFSISLDETVRPTDVDDLLAGLAEAIGGKAGRTEAREGAPAIPPSLQRVSDFLTHPVFNTHHTETELMRYMKKLENRDFSLVHGMIPLGSCTMKLNAVATLWPITRPEWAYIHPYAPLDQVKGYQQVFTELSGALAECTGFTGVSLQPNSGAQGEYAGLLVIRAYHEARGDHDRKVALIPSSAHGTNPASAAMVGMEIVVVKADDEGHIDIDDLCTKAELYKDRLSCLMVTYPSTHGVFEEGITEITGIVHANGGLVYMDGANMNAQVGLTSPGNIGADVCHLNLHKTFAIPHGGGGPGMGPICVNDKLRPFLPAHPLVRTGGDRAIHAVSSAPWGSALILLISYGYIKMLGSEGLKASTEAAILNANYMRVRLADHYPILYVGDQGMVAHEMILDCRGFKKSAGIEVEDIAKRLMDYGFHAPTVSFPVAGTLMIEPTESESQAELDRFCDAMISIRHEIADIENGTSDRVDNVLKNAPHTADEVSADSWEHAYGRETAAFPSMHQRDWKYWTVVSRVDNAYGDRHLVCTCPPMEHYVNEPA